MANTPRPVVLIAADEPAICFSLKSQVLRCGGQCIVASDGVSAIARFQAAEGGVDVAFLDVRMPRMNGPDAVRALRRLDPTLPCCLMTVYGIAGLPDCGDGVALLEKPFDLVDFERMLDALLARSARAGGQACTPASATDLADS
jgi:CheY-like chemotaxis protein